MTNPSHTELAAQRSAFEREYEAYCQPAEADWFRREDDDPDEYYHVTTKEAWWGWQASWKATAAALESPERVQGEAWPADLSSNQRTLPERFAVIKRDNGEPVIDDDDFKFDALIVVHGDFDDGEKEKYVAEVCRRLNAATPPTAPAQDAQGVTVDSIRAAGGIVHSDGNIFFTNIDKLRAALRASSPADRQPLTVEQIEEAFQEAAGADEDTHIRFARGIEALHGIVTKESGNAKGL